MRRAKRSTSSHKKWIADKNRKARVRRSIAEHLEDRRLLVTDVILGEVGLFAGPNDLTLDPDKVVYAINFSNNDPDLVINGVNFQHDRQAIPGAALVGPREVTPWQVTPEFGNSADENNLEQVMADIRWAAAPGEQVRADLDVTPGKSYRVEILISGNHAETRNWDITIDGALAVDEISSLGIQGTPYSQSQSVFWRYDFTAANPSVSIAMGGPNFAGTPDDGGDRNAIWQGLTLHELNSAPVIENLSGDTLVYGGGPQVIDQGSDAELVDDQANLDGGSLAVSFRVGGEAADSLVIDNGGANGGNSRITLGAANAVLFDGAAIGTHNGGGNSLTVDFNTGGTPEAISALLQSITYQDTGGATLSGKFVEFAVDDGLGAVGTAVATVFNPALNGPEETYVWDGDVSGDWADAANWDVGGADPATQPDGNDTAVFGNLGTGQSLVDLGGGQFIGAIRFDNGGYTLTNGVLSVLNTSGTTGRLTQSAGVSGRNTLAVQVLASDLTASIDGGTLAMNDDTNAIDSSSSFTVNGAELVAAGSDAGNAIGSAALNLNDGVLTFAVPGVPPELGGVTTGLELWLDASDASTLFQDAAGSIPAGNGDPIGRWADKSGLDRHAVQTADNERPSANATAVNGRGGVRFNEDNSNNDGMFIGDPARSGGIGNDLVVERPYTVIIVDQYYGGTQGRTLHSGAGRNWLIGKHGGQNRYYAEGWVYQPNVAAGTNIPAIGVGTGEVDNNTFYYLDGADVSGIGGSTFQSGSPGHLAFMAEGNCCGGEASNADVAEVIVYDRVLSDADRQAVEAYLQFKYDATAGAEIDISANQIQISGDSAINMGPGINGITAGDITTTAMDATISLDAASPQLFDLTGTLTVDSTATLVTNNADLRVVNPVVGATQLNKQGPGSLIVSADSSSSILDGVTLDISAGTLEMEGLPAPPSDLGGVTADLELWLDGSDIDADGQADGIADGATITNWADKSGNGHDADNVLSDPSYVASGPNAAPVVFFDGDDQLFLSDDLRGFLGDYSIITVARYTGGDNERVISSKDHNWLFGFWGNGDERWYADGWIQQAGTGNADWHLHSGTMNSAGDPQANFWKDGVQLTVNGTGSTNNDNRKPSRLSLGGWNTTEFSQAEIAEVIIYDRLLSDTERLLVEGYLNAKYGFTSDFPPGHANFSGMDLVVSGDAAIGAAAGTPSGELGDVTIAPGVTLSTSGGGDLTISGTTTIESSVTVNTSGDLLVTGAVTGASDLEKQGAAALTLAAANDYSGQTTVNGGTLAVAHDTALGTAGAGTIVNAGTLQLVEGVSVAGESLTLNGGALAGSGDNRWGGDIVLAANSTITSDQGSLTVDGDVDMGHFVLTTAGAGNVVINGAITGDVFDGGSTLQDFEGAGSPYTANQFNAAPGPELMAGGPTGSFMRLIHDGVNSNVNSVSFDRTRLGAAQSITAEFDFRLTSTNGEAADGMAFVLLPTSTYGTTGQGFVWGGVVPEEPNVPGAFSVGFDVYPAGASTNDVSAHWNGAEIVNVRMNAADIDLDAQVFHHAMVELTQDAANGGSRVSVTLTPDYYGNPGAPVVAIDDVLIPGLSPYESRVEFAARTGGLNLSADIDNVLVEYSGSGSLIKQGGGNLTLRGNNSYVGSTTVRAGALIITNESALGTADGSTIVEDGATLETAGTFDLSAETLVIAGGGVAAGNDFLTSWTIQNQGNPTGPWMYGESAGATGSGAFFLDGTDNNGAPSHSRLTSPSIFVTESGDLTLSFDHRYSIEGGLWDGAAVFVSTNDGPFAQIPNASFTANGYTAFGLIGNHDLNGGEGFGGDSPGYPANITSVADLGTFNAGDEIALQFLMANDEFARGNFLPNWAIDSVQVSSANGDLLNETFDFMTSVEGAIKNSGGDTTLSGPIEISGNTVLNSATAGATLTIDSDLDLKTYNITVNGEGDTVINGAITGDLVVGGPPNLGNINDLPTGNYSFTADGQTFEAYVENDGQNSWLLVGRGRNDWDFDADGPLGNIDDVNQNLGTIDAFTPTAYSTAIINDLLAQSGIDMGDVEVRLSRASDVNGVNPYQDARWRDFTGNGDVWTWDFDDSQYGMTLEIVNPAGVPGADTGVRSGGNTRDFELGGNDGDRVFTWAWDGHGLQRGFSYGSAVGGIDGNDPNTFLWEFGAENHTIPYTEVYIRSLVAAQGGNIVTKIGEGSLTLTSGGNTYAGETRVEAGTLVVEANGVLGSSDSATVVADGATLALSGGATLTNEEILLNGTGAAGQPGALVGLDGNNTVASTATLTTEPLSQDSIGIGTVGAGNLLTINTDVDLQLGRLIVDGDGDTTINGIVGGLGMDQVPAGGSYADQILADNPLFFYQFNEDAGASVIDTSANAVDGRTGGDPTYTAEGGGRSGMGTDRGLTLDGAGDFVDVTDDRNPLNAGALDSISANNQVTLVFWTFSTVRVANFIYHSEVAGDRLGTHLPWSDGNVYFDTGGCCGGTQRTLKAIPDADWMGQWKQWTFVKDGDNKDIYLDGQLWHSAAGQTSPLALIQRFRIGADVNTGGTNYNGIVDDFAVYGTALSAARIQELYDARDARTLESDNRLIKNGGGALTLTANNTYNEGATINGGTLIVTSNEALGADGQSVAIANGATLALSSGATVANREISLDGEGASGRPGTLIGLDGNNAVAASNTLVVPSVSGGRLGVGAASGQLTIDADLELQLSALTVAGDGDVVINGRILGGATVVDPAQRDIILGNSQAGLPGLNPLGYWEFNEGSGDTATDESGNNVSGAIQGATYTADGGGRGGRAGDTALSFDGNDVVSLDAALAAESFPFDAVTNTAGQVSIAFWAFGADPGQPRNNTIFAGYAVGGGNRTVLSHTPWGNGNIYWDVGDNLQCCGGDKRINRDASFDPSLFRGQWNYYTYTKDDSTDTSAIYINGALFHTMSNQTSNFIADTLRTFYIGAERGDGTNGYLGQMDDFSIFDTAFDAAQVQELYDARNGVGVNIPNNSLWKTGGGTLTLSGANTYGDGATVMEGTLIVANSSGSATGSGAVTVQSGATLSGDGTISGDVTAQDGGIISPAPGPLGTGNLTLETGSHDAVAIASSGADQVDATGTVALNNATLDASLETGFRPNDGQTYVIINNDGADAVQGTFAGLPDGGSLEVSDGSANRLFVIDYNYDAATNTMNAGNDVALTYSNRPPVVDTGGPYVINEGSGLTLDGSGTTDPDNDSLTYEWDVNGDGVVDATGVTVSLTLAELTAIDPTMDDGPNSFPVTLSVDDGQATVEADTSLNIVNVAPTAGLSGPSTGVPNLPLDFNLTASNEPGPQDRAAGFTYVIDWGDGETDTIGPGAGSVETIQHGFAEFGLFNVRLTVTDKDGGASVATQLVEVSPVVQVGDDVYVGGSDSKNDRIIIQSAGRQSVFVRYNDQRFGGFDTTPLTIVYVFGGGGHDRISVSNCVTTELHGDEGNDAIYGGPCNDVIHGGDGRDVILTGDGDNWVDGGNGNDSIGARGGNDELNGGGGNDRITAGSGADILRGGSGNDSLVGGDGDDLIVGGGGNDNTFGQGGDDVLVGGDGNDHVRGGIQDDLLVGGFGTDAVRGERGDDVLTGGDAANENDDLALLATWVSWSLNRDRSPLGTFADDGELDGLNGGGGPDELNLGFNDKLNDFRDNDVLVML